MTVTLLCGDCKETLQALERKSVQCVVTSPPYFGLRDYGVDTQIGSEATLSEYVNNLVSVFRLVRDVLKDDGTVWLNLGDTYAANRSYQVRDNKATDVGNVKGMKVPDGLKSKDRMMVPARVAIALQDDGWYLRDEIVWEKPNAMPSSVKDRTTSSHEMLYLLAKRPKYYYNASTIREQNKDSYGGKRGTTATRIKKVSSMRDMSDKATMDRYSTQGRNKRSVWTIPTQAFSARGLGFSNVDHFAAFPTALVEPCILAGSREGDTVLDIFCGSGTVGSVASKYNRNFIGLDLNPDYIEIAKKRIEVGY